MTTLALLSLNLTKFIFLIHIPQRKKKSTYICKGKQILNNNNNLVC